MARKGLCESFCTDIFRFQDFSAASPVLSLYEDKVYLNPHIKPNRLPVSKLTSIRSPAVLPDFHGVSFLWACVSGFVTEGPAVMLLKTSSLESTGNQHQVPCLVLLGILLLSLFLS